MNHREHLQDIAEFNAISDMSKWSSWESPIGLVIFFNGMAVCALIIRYIFLMK